MDMLIMPVITEKATSQSELRNRYTFFVNPKANKIEIKNAIEKTYGVHVENVRTMRYSPDRKTRYTKTGVQQSKTDSYKKAIVQITEGETIDFYSTL